MVHFYAAEAVVEEVSLVFDTSSVECLGLLVFEENLTLVEAQEFRYHCFYHPDDAFYCFLLEQIHGKVYQL